MQNDVRLIDANALAISPDPYNVMNGVRFGGRGGGKMAAMVGMALKTMIDNAPTIDAVPVVHARWIKSNKHVWKKRADGEIDHFAVDFEYHNGPECEICGLRFCEHCCPEKFNEESCKDQYFCSVCGRMETKEEPYCHCGAKMDGGASDD